MTSRSGERVLLTPTQLFHPLPQHHVIVCTSCRFAVPPRAIARHLKEIHGIHRARRRPFLDFVSKFDLRDPEDVAPPNETEFPIPALPILDGLQCTSSNCLHLCVAEKRMQSHWRSVHGRPGVPGTDWKYAPLQTFFRGNLLRYFTNSSNDPYPQADERSNYLPVRKDVLRVTCLDPDMQLRELTLPFSDATLGCYNPSQGCLVLSPFEESLLGHYKNSTSRTIATDLETEVLWGSSLIHMAYHHDFLMRAVLALAALHLAHDVGNTTDQRDYLLAASKFQDIAMAPFRVAVANADKSNCHAILAFTHILVLYCFATEYQDGNLLLVAEESEDITPMWLHFLRSGCAMLCSVWEVLEIGPFRALVAAWEKQFDLPKSIDMVISKHLDHLLEAVPPPWSADAWSDDECIEYRDAASYLALAISCSNTMGRPWTPWDVLRIWPIRLSEKFMIMLATSHPGALILLAHYSVLLKNIEDQWYFRGRATRMIRTIALRLDLRWHRFIEKPLEALNATPVSPIDAYPIIPENNGSLPPNVPVSRSPKTSSLMLGDEKSVNKGKSHSKTNCSGTNDSSSL
jgi:hypothetical protein